MRLPFPFLRCALLLPLLVSLLELGCASGGGPAAELSAEDTAGILAAVYRYQLAHDVRPNTEAVCLCAPGDSREGADPAPDLLRRFASEPKPVLACSACTVEEARVIEKKSGKAALTLYVGSFRPLLSGDVEVEGGVRAGRFSSTHLRYRVVRQGKDWTVTDALGPQVP
jgi:hypothetical protein